MRDGGRNRNGRRSASEHADRKESGGWGEGMRGGKVRERCGYG